MQWKRYKKHIGQCGKSQVSRETKRTAGRKQHSKRKTIGRMENIIYPHKWWRINLKWPALPIYCLITRANTDKMQKISSIVIYHLGSKYKNGNMCCVDQIRSKLRGKHKKTWGKEQSIEIKPQNKWKQRKIMWTTEFHVKQNSWERKYTVVRRQRKCKRE